MNEDREQALDDFLETRAWDAAQQALFDALRAAFWRAGRPPLASGKVDGGRGGKGWQEVAHSFVPVLRLASL